VECEDVMGDDRAVAWCDPRRDGTVGGFAGPVSRARDLGTGVSEGTGMRFIRVELGLGFTLKVVPRGGVRDGEDKGALEMVVLLGI
jgi:hypothetical protein